MDLDELDKAFEQLIQDFPEARKQLVTQSGDKLYRKVIQNIERDVKERRGKLKKSVVKNIGSGGGYAAIRANSSIAPHLHLIENGHKIVKNGNVVGWVSGKHMYRNALNELADELERDAEKTLDDLVGGFGD